MHPDAPKLAAIAAATLAVTVIGIYTVNRLAAVPGEGMAQAGAALERIAAAFRTGAVTVEFRDYVTRTRGTNHLQVASLQSVDTFTRTDSTAIFWDSLRLPDITVELQTPVEYIYYLDLDGPWRFQWEDDRQAVRVDAPGLGWNTPAVDLARLRIRVVDGSLLRDEADAVDRLKRQMPELLHQTARSKLTLVRELARRETRRFVENWFIAVRFQDAAVKPHVSEVYFADEPPAAALTAPVAVPPAPAKD
ncbi:MAG: hypothetical protein GX414_16710 [Acidobacteria bacterium]|nr:hypothetical protein [Acidobacteriota bacterium]